MASPDDPDWPLAARRAMQRALRQDLTAECLARAFPSVARALRDAFRRFADARKAAPRRRALYCELRVAPHLLAPDGALRDAGFAAFSRTPIAPADFAHSREAVTVPPIVLRVPAERLAAPDARPLSLGDGDFLLLPGTFVLSEDLKGTGVREALSYAPDSVFARALLAMDLPTTPPPEPSAAPEGDGEGDGAAPPRFRRSAVLPSKLPPETLGGHYLVYYRAIQGRPAEVLTWRVLPENATELARNARYYAPNRCEAYANEVLPYIPEYRELEARYKKGSAEGPDRLGEAARDRLLRRMASYELHAAVYDPVAKRVRTMSFATPAAFFRELYAEVYERLEEAHDAILAHFAELGARAPGHAPTT